MLWRDGRLTGCCELLRCGEMDEWVWVALLVFSCVWLYRAF